MKTRPFRDDRARVPAGTARHAAYLLALAALIATRPAAGQDEERAAAGAQLYRDVKSASIEVLVDDHLNGSGVFVDSAGTALTAAHVLGRPGSRIEILSPVAGRRSAEVVAVDRGRDLALLRVEPREDGYPALPLADRLPPPGEDVFLLGAPIFRHAVMVRGTVAREEMTFEFYDDRYVEGTHVAATVPMGMSGGPWFSRDGQLVGIQSGVMSLNNIPVGVSFIIPLPAVRHLLEAARSAATPTLGAAVEETWQQQRDFLDRFPPRTEGLVVKVIRQDGPAVRAGIAQWDVITEADGEPVRMPDELLRIIRRKKPGQPLALTVHKPDGMGVRRVTATLGKLEVGWPE